MDYRRPSKKINGSKKHKKRSGGRGIKREIARGKEGWGILEEGWQTDKSGCFLAPIRKKTTIQVCAKKNKTVLRDCFPLTRGSSIHLESELALLMQCPSNNSIGISAIKYSSFYCLANIWHEALLIQGGGGGVAWQVMADQRVEIKKRDVWIVSQSNCLSRLLSDLVFILS